MRNKAMALECDLEEEPQRRDGVIENGRLRPVYLKMQLKPLQAAKFLTVRT